MLKFLHSGFYGENKFLGNVNDISVHEFIVLASILCGLIIFGLFPETLFNFVN